MATRTLVTLQVGDVIVDVQGARHTVLEPVEGPFIDEEGDTCYRVFTDTYPRGGIMNGRTICPTEGPESITFNIEGEK